LGDILKVDSFVLGYDLTSLNLSGETEVKGNMKDLPDVILIKKIFPEHNRIWKLKQLDKEEIDMNNFHKNSNQREKEYNEFLKDLENDPEMRSKINLYRDEKAIQSWKKKNEMKDENEPEEVEKKSKKTKIKIKAKTKKHQQKSSTQNQGNGNGDEEEEEKEQFPNIAGKTATNNYDMNMVKIEELLADMNLEDDENAENDLANGDDIDAFIQKFDSIRIEGKSEK